MKKEERESKEVLIYQSRMSGKHTMVVDAILKWLDSNKKEVKKITIEFL